MLVTRCPSCQTTFRITAEALQKAGGRVRCGRCAAVFNARDALREHPDTPAQTSAGSEKSPAPTPGGRPATRKPAAPPSAPAPVAGPASSAATTVTFGDLTVAELVAQVERGGDGDYVADETEDAAVIRPMSPDEIDAVLETPESKVAVMPADWLDPHPRGSRWWLAAAAGALVTLGVQVVHHYRNTLALAPIVGPRLTTAYAALGAPLAPRWDLAQYQILDWVATAEPNTSGLGTLRISARVHNRGPREQPYPQIHLQLEDRRQSLVGSRIFRPSEYLDTRPRHDSMMAAGETAHAVLEVVDPGPDAYGFELDVCIEIDAVLRCGADQIFK